MIEDKTGDVLAEDVEALVNSVNCVGVMGRGIALQFKKSFPENFKAYAAACKHKEVKPGSMFVFETGHLSGPRYIINFPTKRHWKGKSRIEDIESGLAALVLEIKERNISSIALPPLASGLGGLEWQEVRQRIEEALNELPDVRIVVFEPGGGPVDEKVNRSTEVPRMTPGARGFGRTDGSVSAQSSGHLCDTLGTSQAHVLSAESRRALEAPIPEETTWPIC